MWHVSLFWVFGLLDQQEAAERLCRAGASTGFASFGFFHLPVD